MNLKVQKHPSKPDGYCLISTEYQVVGGAGWLVHTKDLPHRGLWEYKRFRSTKEAKEFAKECTEETAVNQKDIRRYYGQGEI